jgi:hypothetical protein
MASSEHTVGLRIARRHATDGMATLLRIDGIEIGPARLVELLSHSGQLAAVLGWILREHVLDTELTGRSDLPPNSPLQLAATASFRLEHGLPNEAALTDWLTNHGQSREQFDRDVVRRIRVARLKQEVTQEPFVDHFMRRRPFLDRYAITVIRVVAREAALELYERLRARSSLDVSTLGEPGWAVTTGTVFGADLPERLQRALDVDPSPGTIAGPIETDDGFLVVRFDGTIEPSLDDPSVRQRLRNELFEIWVAERLERLDVELIGL